MLPVEACAHSMGTAPNSRASTSPVGRFMNCPFLPARGGRNRETLGSTEKMSGILSRTSTVSKGRARIPHRASPLFRLSAGPDRPLRSNWLHTESGSPHRPGVEWARGSANEGRSELSDVGGVLGGGRGLHEALDVRPRFGFSPLAPQQLP